MRCDLSNGADIETLHRIPTDIGVAIQGGQRCEFLPAKLVHQTYRCGEAPQQGRNGCRGHIMQCHSLFGCCDLQNSTCLGGSMRLTDPEAKLNAALIQ